MMDSKNSKNSVEPDAAKAVTASGSRGGRGGGRGGNAPKSKATGSNKPGALHRDKVKPFTVNHRNYSYDKITRINSDLDTSGSQSASASNNDLFELTRSKYSSNKSFELEESYGYLDNSTQSGGVTIGKSIANIQDCTIFGESYLLDDSSSDEEIITVHPIIQDVSEDWRKEAAKRTNEEKGEARKEEKKAKKPRLTYADCAKISTNIMMEVRSSNPEVFLGQADFNHIEVSIAKAYTDIPKPRPATVPQIFKMGLSQGGLWVAAENEFTYTFCLDNVPGFDCPEGSNLQYTYFVYGPDNRPYKYIKTNVPERFYSSREQLTEMILAFHPILEEKAAKSNGTTEPYHLRISGGMTDKKTDIINGFFNITIEIEEELLPVLAILGGKLRILSTTLNLVGGGLDKHLTAVKAIDVIADDDNMETEDKAKSTQEKEQQELIEASAEDAVVRASTSHDS